MQKLQPLKNLCAVLDELYKKCFDFKIKASEPLLVAEDRYKIEYIITSTSNSNYPAILEFIYMTLKNLSMQQIEIDDYVKSGKNVYSIGWYDGELKNSHKWINISKKTDPNLSKQWKKEQSWFKPSSNLKSSDIENISTFFTMRTAGSLQLLKNRFISSNAAPFLFAICINRTTRFYPTMYENNFMFYAQEKVTNGGYWILNEEGYETPGLLKEWDPIARHQKWIIGFPDWRIADVEDNTGIYLEVYGWREFLRRCSMDKPREIRLYYSEVQESVDQLQLSPQKRKNSYQAQHANSGIGDNIFSLVLSNKSNYNFTSNFTQIFTPYRTRENKRNHRRAYLQVSIV